jgi:TolA-binding protein
MRCAVPEHHPFAPQGELSRERLIAYAEGKLLPREEHEMELHLVQDLLLADAAEGLVVAGAIDGLANLEAQRPVSRSFSLKWYLLLIPIVMVAWHYWPPTTQDDHQPSAQISEKAKETEQKIPSSQVSTPMIHDDPVEEAGSSIPTESSSPDPKPVSAHTAIIVQRETPAESLATKKIDLDRPDRDQRSKPRQRLPRQNRQLYYLHDLKIVHPKELRPSTDPFELLTGIPANTNDRANDDDRYRMRYLPYMDHALGHYTHGRFSMCLAELTELLDQYPDDPNAIFYSALCRYHLGHYDRASKLFNRAATHSIDVFIQEAQWYNALSLEAAGRKEAARHLFDRIQKEGGFYAEKATAKLGR